MKESSHGGADNQVLTNQRVKLDRLYTAVDQALVRLSHHLGISAQLATRRNDKVAVRSMLSRWELSG